MGTFLVSYAPGWSTNPKETPVLLVPGAYTSADTAWASPDASPVGCGAVWCPSTGMMQSLAGAGYKVFGITFPHAVGNNNNHAEQIHGAVQVIKAATGATEVDIVAWSMGTLASRLYVSGATPAWATPYAGDVRKLVLIGGPNKGWDYTFRHGTYPAIASYSECGGSVIGGTAAIWQNCFGFLYSHPELTPYITPSGDFFPGVRQMLRRWDSAYPVNLFNPDAYTTYYGGTGYYGQSFGIQYAISQGSLISTMRASTVPSSIETYLLCGTAPNIPNWNNELDGPSDGTILTASCADTGSIGTVADSVALVLNHLRLTWSSSALTQVSTWLG
jgi:pimeloyl-ACP methyl ester carboxylesterase